MVKDIRSAICALAPFHFDYPAKGIITIGITGTKGKSTVAYIVKNILDLYLSDNNQEKAGLISSIDTYDGKDKFESSLTTPEPIELQEHFYNAKNNGITYMVMEISSQALKFDRIHEIPLEVSCFMNFGKDHISSIEHPDINDYFESKLKIFNQAKFACVNSESDKYDQILSRAKEKCDVVTFGTNSGCDFVCSDIQIDDAFSKFHVKSKELDDNFTISIPGDFNIENALAAISISSCLQIPEKYIKEGLATASVPGRMKVLVSKNKQVRIVVDYAHNEMSYASFYKSVCEQYPKSKIISIFGCPGNKAQNRRADLPKIASKYSDHIIVCEEDSGKEPFENIANDIVSNIEIENYDVIEDRDESLHHALFDLADNDTVIVFLGKGEETYLKRGDEYQPCETDLSIAQKYIKQFDENVGN